MRKKIARWYYRRQYRKAYDILNGLAGRHRDAGHEVYFAEANESDLHLLCFNCPELQPLKRRPEDVVHITRAHDGTDYRG